jgi:hypothetical protein
MSNKTLASVKKIISNKVSLLALLLLSFNILVAQIPERPSPPRLINDFANILQPEERTALEIGRAHV